MHLRLHCRRTKMRHTIPADAIVYQECELGGCMVFAAGLFIVHSVETTREIDDLLDLARDYARRNNAADRAVISLETLTGPRVNMSAPARPLIHPPQAHGWESQ